VTEAATYIKLEPTMMLARHSGRGLLLPHELSQPCNDLHALVIGGSGAIGQCLVAELAANPAYSKITCISRREWSLPAAGASHNKLHHVTCDIAEQNDLVAAVCSLAHERITAAFCTLGTTRRFDDAA
jgi:NAD(P)-dependent dehydrogenase (short-subunit alcohol dehydrogenase family)